MVELGLKEDVKLPVTVPNGFLKFPVHIVPESMKGAIIPNALVAVGPNGLVEPRVREGLIQRWPEGFREEIVKQYA